MATLPEQPTSPAPRAMQHQHQQQHSSSYSPPPQRQFAASNHHSPRFRLCAVCSGPSNGFYFGVLSCRACASFFRRSALERRQYLCRRANNCSIQTDGMRNSCRACRLGRCIQAGMCMDNCATPESKSASFSVPENNAPSQRAASSELMSSSDPAKIQLKMSFDVSLPGIHRFAHSLRNVQSGHKALVNVLRSGGPSFRDNAELRLIRLEEHLQTHRGEISLLLALIREHFAEFETLPDETKVLILKCFAFKLGFMNRAEMTIQTFPDQVEECARIVLHPGCYLDRDQLDYFFSGTKAARPDDHKKRIFSIMDKMGKMILQRYRPLAITQLEFAALVGIQLWNSVEHYKPLSSEFKARREQLFAELHALLAQRLGADPAGIGIRFGQLFGLVLEIAAHAWEMDEALTVLKIFNPIPLPDLWEDLLSGRQKLDIVEQNSPLEKSLIARLKEEEGL